MLEQSALGVLPGQEVYGRSEAVDSHVHLHSEVNAKATLRSGDGFIQRIDVHNRHLVFGNRAGCFADHRVLAKFAAAKTVSHQHHWCRARKVMTATSPRCSAIAPASPGTSPSAARRRADGRHGGRFAARADITPDRRPSAARDCTPDSEGGGPPRSSNPIRSELHAEQCGDRRHLTASGASGNCAWGGAAADGSLVASIARSTNVASV